MSVDWQIKKLSPVYIYIYISEKNLPLIVHYLWEAELGYAHSHAVVVFAALLLASAKQGLCHC